MKRKRNCHGRTRTCSHTVPATICHHHHHLLGRIPELVGAFGNYIVGRHCSRISITWQPCRIILCIRAVAARSSEPGVCAARRLFRGSTVCGDSRGRKHMGRTCAARPNFISTPRNANSSLAAGIEFSRACRCLGCMAINQAFGTILLDMRLSKGKSALIRAGRKIGISPGISLPTSRPTLELEIQNLSSATTSCTVSHTCRRQNPSVHSPSQIPARRCCMHTVKAGAFRKR